jgi:poly-gamma-glutamate synthesis protein (capsule biosynthesis protein)
MRVAVVGVMLVLTLAAAAMGAEAASSTGAPDLAGLAPGGTFFDDDGNIHEGAIEAIAAASITRGCGGDLYCPGQAVTRGQMAAFLVRALDLPFGSGDPFTDDDTSIFEADIAAMAGAGITRGCGLDLFCPDRPVTRGEMAAFLVRALGLPPAPGDPFTDDDSSVFVGDITALAAAGIAKGCNPPSNDHFCPDDPVLRDQMATFLSRALGLVPTVPPPRPALTLAFSGDVLIHRPVWERAAGYGSPYDFEPMFRPIEPIVEGVDLAICHLEVPLSSDNRDLSGYPSFNAPRQVAEGMAAVGYDGCSTASNHSFDQGISGIESTLSVLADAGLAQAGMAVSAEAGRQATLYAVGDHTVAHLSATYWLNGYRLPDDKPWLVQLIDVPSLLDQARAARQDGADVVVASVHCCTEYQATPTGYQRDVARTLIASPDIDLVVGHHAHVVQPIEEISGEYIVYGLGNFLSAQRSRPATQDGVIVTVEFALRGENWSVRGLTAYPTWVEGGSYKILPAGEHNPASWARTSSALRAEGVDGLIVER